MTHHVPLPVNRRVLRCFISMMAVMVFLGGSDCPADSDTPDLSRHRKLIMANAGGMAAITAWGIINWDYFANSPRRGNEEWFSRNSKYGGADKIGHFYLSYALSHLFDAVFESWDYSHEQSALYGSLTSMAMMSWMEIGDSFSSYGFSHEDFIMNILGCAAGYLVSTRPELQRKIDFRVEYVPDFTQGDIFTDYDNTKYVMAFKLNGFDAVQNPFLRHLEFQLGYYTRGYPDEKDKSRTVYMGIGINLSSVLMHSSMQKASKFFNYFQMPCTYFPMELDMNK